MANKLKDNFSNKPFELNVKLDFNDKNKSAAFDKALASLESEGRTIRVGGEASIEMSIKDGNNLYPYNPNGSNIESIVVSPFKEKIEILLEKDNYEGRKMTLLYWHTNNKIILESVYNASIYIKIEFIAGTNKTNFTLEQQPNNAKKIYDIIEDYKDSIMFLDNIFINQDTNVDNVEESDDFLKINDMRKAISNTCSLYLKLFNIENRMNLSFNPEKIVNNNKLYETIEEIYSLIIDKKIIRMRNAIKDFQIKEVSIIEKDLEVGQCTSLTFIDKVEYELLGEKIIVYTANALFNAEITGVNKYDNKIQSVKYKNSEINPMFISFSGFLTSEDALNEQNLIIQKITEYKKAKTLFEYINDEL